MTFAPKVYGSAEVLKSRLLYFYVWYPIHIILYNERLCYPFSTERLYTYIQFIAKSTPPAPIALQSQCHSQQPRLASRIILCRHSGLERRSYHGILLSLLLLVMMLMIQRLHTRTGLGNLIRLSPRRFPPTLQPLLQIRPARPAQFLRPGRLLHGAVAAAEFGAEVRG